MRHDDTVLCAVSWRKRRRQVSATKSSATKFFLLGNHLCHYEKSLPRYVRRRIVASPKKTQSQKILRKPSYTKNFHRVLFNNFFYCNSTFDIHIKSHTFSRDYCLPWLWAAGTWDQHVPFRLSFTRAHSQKSHDSLVSLRFLNHTSETSLYTF